MNKLDQTTFILKLEIHKYSDGRVHWALMC